MIARLLISPSLNFRVEEINKLLTSHFESEKSNILNHPDLLYFPADSKLGIEQARIIKQHFSLKPYSAKGRAVVLEDAATLTAEAQNALLKTLEEPPANAILILAASSESKLLPTILSRCQIVKLSNPSVILTRSARSANGSPVDSQSGAHTPRSGEKGKDLKIEELISSSTEERFAYIEKLKDREEFLQALVSFFHQHLRSQPSSSNLTFVKELIQAEEWANQNVNIRAILEYLMLVMPSK